MRRKFALPAVATGLLYFGLGVVWMIAYNRITYLLGMKNFQYIRLAAYFDWIYLAVTAFLLVYLIDLQLRKRDRVEALLRQERNFVATVLDTVAALVVVLDGEGRIVRYNRACEELTGFAAEENQGKPFAAIFLDEDEKTGFAGVLAKLLAGGRLEECELRWRTARGKRRLISCLCTALRDEKGEIRYIILTGVDITEKRENEEELKRHRLQLEELVAQRTAALEEANSRLRMEVAERRRAEAAREKERQRLYAILEALPVLVHLQEADYSLRFANRLFRENFGWAEGKKCYELIHGRTSPCPTCQRNLVLMRNEPVKEGILSGKGRSFEVSTYPFWDVDGTPMLLSIGVDITERLQMEKKLRESEERYRQLVELSPDAISVHVDGKVVFVNQAAVKMFKARSADELLGRHVLEFVHPDYWELVKQRMKLLQAGERVPTIEEKFLRVDGTVIDVEVSAAPLLFEGKKAVQIVARDITERRQLEQEMARLERLNLVGSMAASIGHELRNPMTTVRGFLQLLQEKEGGRKYSEYFNLMISELDRANAIISEFLSLARDRAIHLEVTDINEVIKAILPLIEADAMVGNMRVEVDLAAGLPPLLLDRNEIRQLILNLVRNGFEAMTAGGVLTLRTYREDGEVVLEVKDRGKGIPPEILAKLGTPFLTTKENGTGLGLAVCYSIAARHQATITVDTGAHGTTFAVRFKIPAAGKV